MLNSVIPIFQAAADQGESVMLRMKSGGSLAGYAASVSFGRLNIDGFNGEVAFTMINPEDVDSIIIGDLAYDLDHLKVRLDAPPFVSGVVED